MPVTEQHLTRRRLMAAGAAATLTPSLPLFAEEAKAESLDAHVLEHVRRTYGTYRKPLHLLLPIGSEANLAPVAAAFTASTDINVTLTSVAPQDVSSEINLDAMLQGRRFDVALPATYSLPDLVSAKAVIPLDAFAARYEPDGYRDGSLYAIGDTFDGQIYGFQTDGDVFLMFYHQAWLEDRENRKEFADRYGYPLALATTWQELDQQMDFFHRPDQGQYGGALFRTPSYMVWEWWARFHAKGIWPFSLEMIPQISGNAGVSATEELRAASAHQVEGSGAMGLWENWRRYEQGDVFANIGWGGTQKFLNSPSSQMRNRMRFAPTPGGLINGRVLSVPYFNWGWNYVVCAASAAPELGYLFALFASTPDMSTQAVRQADGFFDPFRAEHYADAGIIKAYSEPFLQQHRIAMEGAIPDLYLRGQADYVSALAQNLDEVVQGQLSAETAMQRTAQRWELITSRAGRRQQIERWQRLRSKYPPLVRAALQDLQTH